MIKSIKFLMATLLLSFGFAYANPPTIGCGAYRVAPPDTCNSFRQAYNQNGYPVNGIPPLTVINNHPQVGWSNQGQGVVYNNGGQVYGGQQQQIAQVAQGLGGGLSKCEVMGGVAGGTLGSLAVNNTGQATILGAIVGGIVGNAICQNSQGQQVVVQQNGQGQVISQQGVTQQVVSQPVVSQRFVPQNDPCSHEPGKKPGMLNLPGNPKHGQSVCAVEGDPNISKWL